MNNKKDIIARINKEGDVAMDLRKKHPKRGLQIDYKNGRTAAIELFCLHCMGGGPDAAASAKACQSYTCPLWRFRYGATKGQIPPITLPTQEWYQKKIDASVSDAKREHGRKMGKARSQNNE